MPSWSRLPRPLLHQKSAQKGIGAPPMDLPGRKGATKSPAKRVATVVQSMASGKARLEGATWHPGGSYSLGQLHPSHLLCPKPAAELEGELQFGPLRTTAPTKSARTFATITQIVHEASHISSGTWMTREKAEKAECGNLGPCEGATSNVCQSQWSGVIGPFPVDTIPY
jgi:hypothetical protein